MAEGVVASRLVHTRAEKGRIIKSAFVSTIAVVEENEEGQMWATSREQEQVLRDDSSTNPVLQWPAKEKREDVPPNLVKLWTEYGESVINKLLRKAPTIEPK